MNKRFSDAYREEAAELIAGLETALLELEQSPRDPERVGAVFRAMHTLKGSGAMFGFEAVAEFLHEVESAYDLVRNGTLSVTPELISVTLEARDHVRLLIDNGSAAGGPEILTRLRRLVGDASRPSEAGSPNHVFGQRDGLETFRIRFTPAPDCVINGANPVLLLKELGAMGRHSMICRTGGLPLLHEMDPELCYLGWDIVLTTPAGIDAVREVFIFVESDSGLSIEAVSSAEDRPDMRIGEILVDRGDASTDQVEAALGKIPRSGQVFIEEGYVEPEQVRAALAEQRHIRETRDRKEREDAMSSVRVPAEKLDSLVNAVGELVTVQARLSQLAGRGEDPELHFVAEEVERLAEKLRDTTMSVRMMPIGETFARFRRVVRDLSRQLNKDVELHIEGGETELDKTVIERLNDPLMHLIRNSMDHGIEPPDGRAAAGKPPKGRISLSAAHSGTNVLIRIADDGAGLDTEAIRRRAVERGLAQAGSALTDDEIHAFILQPGFSTANRVTEVSGRGVGMDAVAGSIESLRGSLQISSVRGKGSTFLMRIPLTLAIIDGLLVQAGSESFVLPLSNILECIELGPEERRLHGGNLVVVRNEPVGCIRLREAFGIPGEIPRLEQVVVAETAHGKYGFVVDVVVGDHQTVIKPLSGIYRHISTISGATILGDGAVALIVDLDKTAATMLAEEAAHRRERILLGAG